MSWRRACVRTLLIACAALLAAAMPYAPAGAEPAPSVAVAADEPSVAVAADEPSVAVAADDPAVRYVGRWDRAEAGWPKAGWAGAYFRVGFTGTTVKLKQRGPVDLWASIDGGQFVRHDSVRGTVNLTPTLLEPGEHTLAVSYRQVAGSYRGDAVFGGLELDPGARAFVPRTSAKLIEFIGDSITAGVTTTHLALSDYAWIIGEELGVEHTQIAQGGACLRELTPAESTRGISCVGLKHRFSRVTAEDTSAEWDHRQYQANAVVINIGTNDRSHGVTGEQFEPGYVDLLRQIRAAYPNAAIFAMGPFNQRYVGQIQAAVATMKADGDGNLHYVDTAGWITGEDRNDSTHPSDSGHRKIAGLLKPIIAAKLGTVPDHLPRDGATGLPGPGVLSTTSGWLTGQHDGTYDVTMNLWWGVNAGTFVLYENGVEIARRDLTVATPGRQSVTVTVTGRANGRYVYTGELRNGAGVTVTTPATVAVTEAAPARPVLSADNWDGDGTYPVGMNLWWGTNATEYRLYEDGVLVDSQQLATASPHAQSASTVISGRAPGTRSYVAELVNPVGSVRSEPVVVTVAGTDS